MRDGVARLRLWLLGSAVFLLLVIAAYIGVARYVRHRFLTGIPAKLGINIVSEANGYTYCQSVQGRTLYCIHAAKWEKHTDGKIALHDVSVTLYGSKGDRSDHIYGDEFEYDQNGGVIRALGLVHIDLQAADAGKAVAGNGAAKPKETASRETTSDKVVHVTTSGLVYLQKLGVASTNDPIEFETGAMTGHATGADYSSDSGLLMLHSAVSMSGMNAGRPVSVTAATAEFDEHSQQAFLTHWQYDSQGQTAAAEKATLHRRTDGTLERVEAQGSVTIRADGATTVSQRADVALNEASQPQTAVLDGGVLYTLDEPLRQARGQANEATIAFDKMAKPQPRHVRLTGGVHMIERTRATEAAREPWSVRDLTADKVEAELARTSDDKVQLRDAEAIGNAHLVLVDNGNLAGKAGAGRKELSAADLKGHLRASGGAKEPPQLDTVTGRGHTVLRQVRVGGIEQISMGDSLDAKFRPATGKARPVQHGSAANRQGAEDLEAQSIESALQLGHLTMMQRTPAKKAGASDEVRHVTAQRAAYDGDLERMTLTGGVQMTDADSALWANQVALDRATGDAHALGAVKVNYVQDPAKVAAGNARTSSAEPTHILADRAELEHETNIVTFYGKPVRLWQSGSQVQAPEIEIEKEQQRLIARGSGATGWSGATQPSQVHTVLAREGEVAGAPSSAGKDATVKCGTGAAGTKAGADPGAARVVRIVSGGLVYSGILGQAKFTGGVQANTVDAIIHANEATAYLTQKSPNTAAGAPAGSVAVAVPSLNWSLERVIAAGQVEVRRPGLEATGDRLLYTVSDQVYLLTGTKDAPPRAVDAQGMTTAAALRVRNICDASGGVSVEALGEVPGEPAQRVHTESRVSNDRKKEKASK